MAKIITIDEQVLRQIFDCYSKKCVGTCLKRFEIHSNPEEQKKAIKEVLYENLRNIQDAIILYGATKISAVNTNQITFKKE